MDIKDLQAQMTSLGLYAGPIGAPANTKAHDDAVMAYFRLERVKDWDRWNAARRTIAGQQLVCRGLAIPVGDIDGLMGPMTLYAFEVFDARKANGGHLTEVVPEVEEWRDDVPPQPPVAKPSWPLQRDCMKFFGPVGTNQVTLVLPYPMKLAWDLKQTVTKTSCHKLVKPSFERVFKKTLAHYGIEQIRKLRLDLFGGCLNVRKMRGGSNWSMHAWGIAFDIDPSNNALHTKKPAATLSRPVYDPFWSFVEAEGLVSLGRLRDFDWMHFQAARL